MNFRLNILLLKEGDGKWTAQCLERDITAQGETIDKALFEFQRTLISEVAIAESAGEEPLKDILPAPACYWQQFHSEGKLVDAHRHVPFQISPTPSLNIPEFREFRVA